MNAQVTGSESESEKALLTGEDYQWIAQQVREDQFSLIFSAGSRSSFAAVATAAIMWLFLYYKLKLDSLLVWGLLMHTCQYLRAQWIHRYTLNPKDASMNGLWTNGYFIGLGASGILWGLIPIAYFDKADPLTQTFMLVLVLGIFNWGLSWMATVRVAAIVFSYPIALSVFFTLLWQEDFTYRIGGLLCALYMYFAWKFSSQYYSTLRQSLIAQYEAQLLTQRLHMQIDLVKQASLEKSRFMAAASHDLRQPLQAIAIFGAVLSKELLGTPQQLHAAHSQKAIRALSESLDAMLDVSRLDAGVVEVITEPIPLNRLFRKLSQIHSPQAIQTDLQLRFRATPLWIHSDEQLLERVVSNLISNALKYTARGGVLIAARRRGESVIVDVFDTGIGIALDQQDRIFEEFYQINNPGRDRNKGMGMGLAIVRRMTRLLGHRLDLTSLPGRGSRFRITLPLACADGRKPSFDPETSARFSAIQYLPKRVLILDDEVSIQQAFMAMLTAHGVEAVCVSTPEEALQALKRAEKAAPFNIFLCDFRLTDGADGVAFALDLRKKLAFVPPVLVVTGETYPMSLQRLRDAGLPVLFKPVSESKLLQALTQYSKP